MQLTQQESEVEMKSTLCEREGLVPLAIPLKIKTYPKIRGRGTWTREVKGAHFEKG